MKTLSVVLGLAASAPAFAGITLGVGADLSASEGNKPSSGADLGFTGRVGYTLDIGVIDLTPEVVVGGHGLGLTPRLGGVVRIGKIVEPGAYAHVLMPVLGYRGWDAGGVLDFTAAPMFDVGIHAGVLSLQHRDAPTALGGVHFALSF